MCSFGQVGEINKMRLYGVSAERGWADQEEVVKGAVM